MYKRAVELDPSFILAWAGLARINSWMNYLAIQTFEINDMWTEDARFALDRIAVLEIDHIEAYIARGYYYYYGQRDYHQAFEQFEEARKRQPGNAEILIALALVKRRLGQWNESVAIELQALELNPRNFALYYDSGISLCFMRRYAEAEPQLMRTFALEPEQYIPAATQMPSLYLSWDGNTTRARASLREAAIYVNSVKMLLEGLPLSVIRCLPDVCKEILDTAPAEKMGPPDSPILYLLALAEMYAGLNEKQRAVACYDSIRIILEEKIAEEEYRKNEMISINLGHAYAGTGRNDEALQHVKVALKVMPISRDAVEGALIANKAAEIFVTVGEYEAALDLLDELLSVPSLLSVNLLRLDPIWNPLRNNPDFKGLIEKYSKEY